ncbi:YdcF family protein [Sphingobacterium sp. MYb382]|uniref:YdcF family protein n=1 Tax=Sphingobacterium sp. MYb382 TaxID=2745278 RepID=UPI0030B07F7E
MTKLREINKIPIPPVMSADMIAALTKLCFFSAALRSADVLFVFGSHIRHREIAHIITDILHEHLIPTVILTGGIADYKATQYVPQAESSLLFELLPKNEFSHTTFILEAASKNTLENVQNAMMLFDFDDVKKVLFISHAYAARRAALTLKRYLPDVSFGNYPVVIPSIDSDFSLSKQEWYKTEYGRSIVWGEYLRIKTYGERGDFPIGNVRELMDNVAQYWQSAKR